MAHPAELDRFGPPGRSNDDSVQALDIARHFVAQSEYFFNPAQALVHERGAFEVHLRAQAFAGRGGGSDERSAAGMEEIRHALRLPAILVFINHLLARTEAAAHLSVH